MGRAASGMSVLSHAGDGSACSAFEPAIAGSAASFAAAPRCATFGSASAVSNSTGWISSAASITTGFPPTTKPGAALDWRRTVRCCGRRSIRVADECIEVAEDGDDADRRRDTSRNSSEAFANSLADRAESNGFGRSAVGSGAPANPRRSSSRSDFKSNAGTDPRSLRCAAT